VLMTTPDTIKKRKPFKPDYDTWEPPSDLLDLLADKALQTRDKVELVFSFYARDHKGQGPWAREIACVLSIAKQNVERRMTELIAEGRAKKINGKFVLTEGKYSHPAIRKFPDSD
jgi:hypothetical protein